MKIKKTFTQEIEVDINIPSYWKFSQWQYYAVLGENKVIYVYNGGDAAVELRTESACNIAQSEETTEAEFNAIYFAAKQKIDTTFYKQPQNEPHETAN